LVFVGLAVSIVGWQTGWFADEDTPALGGAILFEMMVGAPIAIGAGLGVYVMRARSRRRRDEYSTLPIIGQRPERRGRPSRRSTVARRRSSPRRRTIAWRSNA
jgi:hypothetical protein